jgi:hypothetical protein
MEISPKKRRIIFILRDLGVFNEVSSRFDRFYEGFGEFFTQSSDQFIDGIGGDVLGIVI